MRRTRVIPCLLLTDHGLVKTERFSKPRYLGDVLNAVRIFNEKEADELMILDIDASTGKRGPNLELLKDIAAECFMPLTYGGGVRSVADMEAVFAAGCEKVAMGSAAAQGPKLIQEGARAFGSQSIAVIADVFCDGAGDYTLMTDRGKRMVNLDFTDFVRSMESAGAGEIILQSVDRDGRMAGYDLELIQQASRRVSIPVVALGGAGNLVHLREAVDAGASAVAAGSLFVLYGKHRAVLITYPEPEELKGLFSGVG